MPDCHEHPGSPNQLATHKDGLWLMLTANLPHTPWIAACAAATFASRLENSWAAASFSATAAVTACSAALKADLADSSSACVSAEHHIIGFSYQM
jgi:hypothetical protein